MNIQELKEKADDGLTPAQAVLGILYLYGDEVPKDYNLAFHYLSKAAEKGASRAILHLGAIYEDGLGQPQDIEKALQLYKKVANCGEPIAFISLARIYRHGKSSAPPNISEAVFWYKKMLEFKQHFENDEIQEAIKFLQDN
jgi:TPR repeat protein